MPPCNELLLGEMERIMHSHIEFLFLTSTRRKPINLSHAATCSSYQNRYSAKEESPDLSATAI